MISGAGSSPPPPPGGNDTRKFGPSIPLGANKGGDGSSKEKATWITGTSEEVKKGRHFIVDRMGTWVRCSLNHALLDSDTGYAVYASWNGRRVRFQWIGPVRARYEAFEYQYWQIIQEEQGRVARHEPLTGEDLGEDAEEEYEIAGEAVFDTVPSTTSRGTQDNPFSPSSGSERGSASRGSVGSGSGDPFSTPRGRGSCSSGRARQGREPPLSPSAGKGKGPARSLNGGSPGIWQWKPFILTVFDDSLSRRDIYTSNHLKDCSDIQRHVLGCTKKLFDEYATSKSPVSRLGKALLSFGRVCAGVELEAEEKRALRMLLLHQKGSVKVGEVVRYTLTYTPSEDRILPPPSCLHVRIRNSSAIPLRAAYLHGPYTIHVSAYPSTFNPNVKVDDAKTYGVPDFEPNVKAGGYWNTKLTVPEHTRTEATDDHGTPKRVTWIIEIASQIIFSNSASVNYELLVARDERSLDLGFTAVTGNSHGTPGRVQDHQQGSQKHVSGHPAQPKGVYSKAVKLVVDDTTSLWNKPELPEWNDEEQSHGRRSRDEGHTQAGGQRKKKNVHLVIVTHGLHSNLGADMLYLKESIDATARQARESRRQRRREQRAANSTAENKDTSTAPLSGGQDEISDAGEDEDEEDVVVRGFNGNVIRTERGIQYLGKRLAKYVLQLTYPDQPFLPIKKSMGQKISNTFSPTKDRPDEGIPSHHGSSVHHASRGQDKRAYQFTSISFIGHSLGGLVQTYAIAYIHKHSPHFFDTIKPVNFIAMATPFLGLSNENPTYVKFALDFGLVGRTGQDLGLTWRAPTLARSGWTAMGNVFGNQAQDPHQEDPGAKPLLRILPTGPAHQVLRRFRNRTIYSNVVNDGIVPLRTSCLLFLDWRGLGRVEKARRENGLIGTVAVWGYGQITGQNSSPNPSRIGFSDDESSGVDSPSYNGDDTTVPLPGADITNQEDEAQVPSIEPAAHQVIEGQKKNPESKEPNDQYFQPQNTLMQLWSYIRPTGKHTSRDKKMFSRSQTIYKDDDDEQSVAEAETPSSSNATQQRKRPQATRGDSIVDNPRSNLAPPKTTIFESAGDLINPPVPPQSWIIDPSTRARAIFHDRIYHPEDIPPPPTKKKPTRNFSGDSSVSQTSEISVDESVMRVEEKIARAYHKDLSWRKVLVSLEPDAHNNMIVRRMFANAYGWPVVKHLCDTHFADTYSAETRDEDEPAIDRAQAMNKPINEDGERVKGQETLQPPIERTESEMREVADELAPLKPPSLRIPKRSNTTDSMRSIGSGDWDSIYFNETSDEEDEMDERNAVQRFFQPNNPKSPRSPPDAVPKTPDGKGTSEADISDFLHGTGVEYHRGLGASPRSKTATLTREPDSIESTGEASQDPEEGKQTSSRPGTPIGRISGVGLRNSIDIPASPESSKARRGSSGVAEQVARLSSPKNDKQSSSPSKLSPLHEQSIAFFNHVAIAACSFSNRHSASLSVAFAGLVGHIHWLRLDWAVSVRSGRDTLLRSNLVGPLRSSVFTSQIEQALHLPTMVADSVNPAWHMGPANIGGRRRRITRRPNMPRSKTTPVLSPESPNMVDDMGGVTTRADLHRTRPLNVSSSSEPFPTMINTYVANNGHPADARPSSSSRPSDSPLGTPTGHSPTPSITSATSTITESRKKHGMFGLKSKESDRPRSSQGSPHQPSPLPPLTPVKAAQLLGVDSSAGRARRRSLGRQIQNDRDLDGLSVRPTLKKQASVSVLTTSKDFAGRQTRFREKDVEPDPPKSKGLWGIGSKKAQRMLGLLPAREANARRETDLDRVASESLAPHLEEDNEAYYSSEPNLHARPRLLPAPRPILEAPQRLTRKRLPKTLDRMTPITETSHDELRTFYNNSEHNPELDLISEYEHDYPYRSDSLPRSHTESLLTNFIYELKEEDLSPMQRTIEEDAESEEEEHTVHPGNEIELETVQYEQPKALHLRGPLQTVEDRLLDAAEAELAASKTRQNMNDVARLVVDTQTSALRVSHEAMKANFAATLQGVIPDESFSDLEDENEYPADLISIRSSIDLEEEPTVHVAKVMMFRRITSGMVKFVETAHKKKAPKSIAPVIRKSTLPLSRDIEPISKPACYFQHDKRISPFNECNRNVEAREHTLVPGDVTSTVQPIDFHSNLTTKNYNRLYKPKKAKMPRGESQILVKDWVSTYDHAKQRPLSERVDLDVLADQQIPPAPFPKGDYPTPLPPPRTSSKEHFCLKNGHIFHPIDLKTVPDEVAINSLEVRPYLHTRAGRKQHVHIPVFCDRCGDDVKEELWQCDIAVCHMVVCKACAVDMDHEWQERVTEA
ncbi:duf676-domain-containing protein [Stemphylium lycopersici]|nr:duf676-domain-containing protein [Stemphylium lycopersici]RAR03798.1 duf676-domain-containing protein [Stemphylium lycopersici]